MLLDLLQNWGQLARYWILWAFDYIFPEYPKIGIIVVISCVLLFIYYLIKAKPKTALNMLGTSLAFFIVLLYSTHWLIKLYRVVL